MSTADDKPAVAPESAKARLQREIAVQLAGASGTSGWTPNGFQPDLDLLGRVLAMTNPADVRGGSVATGLDMWAAATLRQAGLEGVIPAAGTPFSVSAGSGEALGQLEALQAALRRVREALADPGVSTAARRAANAALRPAESRLKRVRTGLARARISVLGESRRKQVDVFLAEWDRGLELLISTKTFALASNPAEAMKNLPNRWEEFDGDLKNLRGRFPLAVIGALVVVPAATIRGTLPAFVDMMVKLTAPGRPWVNAYDAAAIVIADWDEAGGDMVPILNAHLSPDELPDELQPAQFFDSLLRRLFQRAPFSEHLAAREASLRAEGLDVATLDTAANITDAAMDER